MDPDTGLASIVREHYQRIYRVAYRLAGSTADAEDLTQQTFLQAQRRFTQLRRPESTLPWLMAILRNCFRRSLRGRKVFSNQEDLEADASPRCEPQNPVDEEQLQRALSELPEEFRTPVVLFYFREMTYQQIAQTLRVPIGTVMSRLARGKARLRASLSVAAKPQAEVRP